MDGEIAVLEAELIVAIEAAKASIEDLRRIADP